MSNTATAAQSGTQSLAVALIKGRIAAVRETGGQRAGFLHVIRLPAPDEYSSPSVVEVFSPQRLGEVDSVWHGRVQIGGYGRSYKKEVEDPRTGEIRQRTIPTADNTLTAVL